jgi:lipid-A-disaccharide synthase
VKTVLSATQEGVWSVEGVGSLLMVAGETSGDQHGAVLIQALRTDYPQLQIYGLGGAQMRAAGAETLYDIGALNAVGAVEILGKIPQGLRMARHLRAEAARRGTRVAVLIDAPGFNLAFARQLKRAGLRIVYYISPQIWAWRQGRVKKIARRVDKMLTLFPFEVPFYAAAGVDAEYVGHPLLDRLRALPSPEQAATYCGLDPRRPIVALLPGSRPQEVHYHLSPMLEALQHIQQRLPQVQGVLPVAPTLSVPAIQQAVQRFPLTVRVLQGQSAQALQAAAFAIVASGTATLEAGFIGTPLVVIYKVHPCTAFLARRLIRIPWIGLVNIVAGRQLVPELVQQQVQPHLIAAYALQCLEHPQEAQRMRSALAILRQVLGQGDSARRAAASVSQFLRSGCPKPSPLAAG